MTIIGICKHHKCELMGPRLILFQLLELDGTLVHTAFMELESWGDPASTAALYT